MRLSVFYLSILAAAWPATAAPLDDISGPQVLPRAAGDRGSYTVSGLGSRKQAILSAGGNTLDMAIAMLETENMEADYAYGEPL